MDDLTSRVDGLSRAYTHGWWDREHDARKEINELMARNRELERDLAGTALVSDTRALALTNALNDHKQFKDAITRRDQEHQRQIEKLQALRDKARKYERDAIAANIPSDFTYFGAKAYAYQVAINVLNGEEVLL